MNHSRNMSLPNYSESNPDEASAVCCPASMDASLKLENQLCFPLYAASRLMVQLYKPHLALLSLTYPQYLVMMVLWRQNALSVRQIGELLHLDSATLTQVLNNLEKAGYVVRERVRGDARTVINTLTPKGRALKKRALRVPAKMSCVFEGHAEELAALKPLLQNLVKLLSSRVARL